MYERFTDRARSAWKLADEEAWRFHHEYVGTEHLFLAMLSLESCAAVNALNNLNVHIPEIRFDLEKLMLPGFYPVTPGKLPRAPRVCCVIDYAVEESKKLEHRYLGTEHLLLGLWRERGGLAAKVIHKLNIPIEEVREEVLRLLREGINTGDNPPRPSATKQPQKIMKRASEEARRLHHEHIGTEHLLLAIASLQTGFVPHLFDKFGITGEELRNAVEKMFPRGEAAPSEGKLPHTPNMRKVIEHAIEEARNLEHNYVGIEHLLLGLSRLDDCQAVHALKNLFIEPDDLRFEITQLLDTGGLREENFERDTTKERHQSLFHRMKDRITDRVRSVLRHAIAEARSRRHDELEAEHLLFGILTHGQGLATEALKHQELDLADLQAKLAELLNALPSKGELKHPRPGLSIRSAIQHSIEEARSLNHNYVGTEHLLLGILREATSPAAQLLEKHGVTLGRSRDLIHELLKP